MPDLSSYLPENIFYAAIGSEFLRIARSTLLYEDFKTKAHELTNRMQNQGASSIKTMKCIQKVVGRHPDAFSSFDVTSFKLKQDLFLWISFFSIKSYFQFNK